MDVPKLIIHVKKYPELYDVNHPDYFNNARREVVWDEIGAAINKPSNECKERWAKVRDNHRKALKRRRTRKHAAGGKHSKPPRYGNELAFLASHLLDDSDHHYAVKHPPLSPSDEDSTTLHNDQEDQDVDTTMQIINGKFQQNFYNEDDEESCQSATATNIPTFNLWDLATASNTATNPKPPRKRTKVEVRDDLVADVLEDYLVSKRETAGAGDDSLLTFFASMAKTVHTFPQRDQIEMKRKVFQVISDREMEIALRDDKQMTSGEVKEEAVSNEKGETK